MQRFFVFGYNKSGTTFLQQLLDSHPNVNCPSEHHFSSVIHNVYTFGQEYVKRITMFDERTAQQGIRFDESKVLMHTFRAFVEASMECGADTTTTHVGVNDNSIGLSLEYYDTVFPESRFITILRDPREVTVSLFHHKWRTEEISRQENLTLSAVAEAVGPSWKQHMEKLSSFSIRNSSQDRLCVTRYEDLIGAEKNAEFARILSFLRVPYDAALLRDVLAANDFSVRRKNEADGRGSFLRSGSADTWKEELGPMDVASIERNAGEQMLKFGYELTQQE